MSEKAVDIIRRANAAFNTGDSDALLALFDPEIEFVDHLPLPDFAQAARGTDEIRTILGAWREGFVGFEADVQEYVDLGDFVVCATRWHFASRDGGIELDWNGAEAWQLRDGKIVWGQAGFLDKRSAINAVKGRSRSAT
jgi:ketosteroid isomerase-like protein